MSVIDLNTPSVVTVERRQLRKHNLQLAMERMWKVKQIKREYER